MSISSHKKKRRKTRYRKVNFKLTSNQMKSIQKYCEENNTSPIRLIKEIMKPYTSNKAEKGSHKKTAPIEENQIDLLSMIDEVSKLSIKENISGPEAWKQLSNEDFPADLFS